MRIDIALAYGLDDRGRTRSTAYEPHIRDMIEQVLFTSPGERVNRPDFGCGLLALVFHNISDEVLSTTRFMAQASLQRWLGGYISVGAVDVERQDSSLFVTVRYTVLTTKEQRAERFSL
jgi:phage baseplate assembly protein W